MRIGIIGGGHIGGNLGTLWAAAGHAIMYGLRDVTKYRDLLEHTGAQAGSPAEAAQFGEVVLAAIGWPAMREVIPALGDLTGKILIDPSNRFAAQAGDSGSAAEDVAHMARGARVIKAFNTIGAETLLKPEFGTTRATTFVCGDDAHAKTVVMDLARDAGLDAVDAGSLASAALVESATRLWFALSQRYGRDIAFCLLRR